MKKVLIISPHFPPINSADSQRVRMSLPYYEKYGWKADVLCLDPENDKGILDYDLTKTVPDYIDVHRTRVIPENFTKFIGFKGVQYRSIHGLYKQGTHLIKKNRYDLIFFSTTVFPVLTLGMYWKRKFGIPYVLDIQDPWINDYPYENPPGGKIKFFISNLFAKIFEPPVINNADHIIFVSDQYPDIYRKRYKLGDSKFTVLPFGFSKKDFDLLKEIQKSNLLDDKVNNKNWVYIGRGGEDLQKTLDMFFSAVKQEIEEQADNWKDVKLNFVGTSYADDKEAEKTVSPLALKHGLQSIVTEKTGRIPYLQSLRILKESDVIMMFGSLDRSYSPSKIYPYVYSGKPLFAIFNSEGAAFKILKALNCRYLTGFNTNDEKKLNIRKTRENIRKIIDDKTNNTNFYCSEIEKFESENLTKIQCEIFDRCLEYTR